jgi:hypothetical protein
MQGEKEEGEVIDREADAPKLSSKQSQSELRINTSLFSIIFTNEVRMSLDAIQGYNQQGKPLMM